MMMKLLLDEQMPRKIAKHFDSGITVDHVQLVGWTGIKNGELLKLAAAEGYDALISADKNMSYQQNNVQLPISVVVLHVLRLRIEDLAPLIPAALRRLSETDEPKFIKIEA
jgi:predicted nuclease of predicted toxin-antitoxin system